MIFFMLPAFRENTVYGYWVFVVQIRVMGREVMVKKLKEG